MLMRRGVQVFAGSCFGLFLCAVHGTGVLWLCVACGSRSEIGKQYNLG